MRKVILFGKQFELNAWFKDHVSEFKDWNYTLPKRRLWKKDGSDEILLVVCDYMGCEQSLRGQTFDEVEVVGQWHEYLHRANEVARMYLRRATANV